MPQLVTGSFSLFLAAPAGCLRGRRARMRWGGGNGGACAAKGGPALRPPSGSAARVARAPGWSPRAASSRPCAAHGRSQGRGSRDASARRRDRRRARMRGGARLGRWRAQAALWRVRPAPGARRDRGRALPPRDQGTGFLHARAALPPMGVPTAASVQPCRLRGGGARASGTGRADCGRIPGAAAGQAASVQAPPPTCDRRRAKAWPVGQDPGGPLGVARLRTAAHCAEPPRYPYGRRPHGPLPAGSGADCERVGYRAWQGACQPPGTGRSCDPQRAKPSGAGANRRLQGTAPRGFPRVQEVSWPPEFPPYFVQQK